MTNNNTKKTDNTDYIKLTKETLVEIVKVFSEIKIFYMKSINNT